MKTQFIKTAAGKAKTWLVLLLLSMVLVSCASEEEVTDCATLLDDSRFDEVVADTSCSTYERGSAYLGKAGFLFSGFLADGAADNFWTALGIPTTLKGTSFSSWEGKTFYNNARQLTGAATTDGVTDYYSGQTRANEDIEIHFFSTLAYLLAETYVDQDTDADGSISDTERQSFTKLASTASGTTSITSTNYLQFVKSDGTVLLIDTSLSSSNCHTNSTYSGIWSSSDATSLLGCGLITSTEIIAAATTKAISITGTCNAVAKVDDMQNLFSETITAGSAPILTYTSSFISRITELNTDLVALNSPDDFTDALKDFTDKIDNGATCTNTTKTSVDKLLNLVNASTSASQTSYKSYNTITAAQLTSADSTASIGTSFSSSYVTGGTTYTVSFTCSGDINARLIFKNSGATGYQANYSDAYASVATSFSNLSNMQKDATSTKVPSTKGDNIVSFEELLCME